MIRGHVVAQSCDVSGNILGRDHANHVLDTTLYQVEFTGGDITELTINVIAESLYIQCDADGNEYSLLDLLVDYQQEDKVISFMDQQTNILFR